MGAGAIPGAGPQRPVPIHGPEGGGIVRAAQPEQLHLSELRRDTTDPSKVYVTITGSGGTFNVTVNANNASEEKIIEFAKQLFYLAVAHNVSESKTISYKQATPDTPASLIVQKQGKNDQSYRIDNLSTHLQDRKHKLELKKADAEILRNLALNAPNLALSAETPDAKIPKRKLKLDEAYTQKIEKVATALAFFTRTERRVSVAVEEEQQLDPEIEEERHPNPYPHIPLAQLKQKLMLQGSEVFKSPNFDDLIQRTANLTEDSVFTEAEKRELLNIYENLPPAGYESYKINITSSLLNHALKNENPNHFNDVQITTLTSAVKQAYRVEDLSPEQKDLLKAFLAHAPNSTSEDIRSIAHDLHAAGFSEL